MIEFNKTAETEKNTQIVQKFVTKVVVGVADKFRTQNCFLQ